MPLAADMHPCVKPSVKIQFHKDGPVLGMLVLKNNCMLLELWYVNEDSTLFQQKAPHAAWMKNHT